jgi:hypothetical protein
MSRAEHLAPDGWTPRRGYRVSFTDAKDSPAPPGTWYVTERAPDGWWCRPTDEAARAWLAAHPSQALQGHLALNGARGAPGRRMVPAGVMTLPGT